MSAYERLKPRPSLAPASLTASAPALDKNVMIAKDSGTEDAERHLLLGCVSNQCIQKFCVTEYACADGRPAVINRKDPGSTITGTHTL